MIMIVVNSIYQGDVAYVAILWKQSTLCRITGTIMISSVCLSNVSMLLIAIDRFVCIVWMPFRRYGLSNIQCLISVGVGWLLVLIIQVFVYFLSYKEISNTSCVLVGESLSLPFSIMYVCLHSILFIGTLVPYMLVMRKVSQSRKVKKSSDKTKQVIIRLGLVLSTNLITTMAVTMLSIISLVTDLSSNTEAIVSFLLFPLNACLNPLLNTITTKDFLSARGVLLIKQISSYLVTTILAKVRLFCRKYIL